MIKRLLLSFLIVVSPYNALLISTPESMVNEGVIFEGVGAVAVVAPLIWDIVANQKKFDPKKLGLILLTPVGGACAYALRSLDTQQWGQKWITGILLSSVTGFLAQKLFNDTKIKTDAGERQRTMVDHVIGGMLLGLGVSAVALLCVHFANACGLQKVLVSQQLFVQNGPSSASVTIK